VGNILIDKKATISVCMITYNHANFIEDSIENILNQIVENQIELIICDDCSFDNTEFIINKLINEHVNGSLIKYFRQNENIGMEKNFIFALKKCSGKYIAFCEGDDYWNDKYKLQKQIDFLENNNIYSACFHNVKVHNEVDLDKKIYDWSNDKEIALEDLFQGTYMKTCSLMIKNEQRKFSSMYLGLIPADDISLGFSILSDGSKAIYLSDSMSVYRIHAGGIWSSKSYRDKILWSAKNQIKYLHFFKKNSSVKILQSHFRGQMTQAIKYSISNIDFKLFFKSIFYFIKYGNNH
jgi:glycosyltransferase involved in cell wall biosynthesis